MRTAFLLLLSLSFSAARAETILIVNKSDGTVSFLNAKSGRVRASALVGEGPHEVEVLADGKTAAVSDYGRQGSPGRTITLLDISRGARVGTVDLGEGTRPHGMDALADGRLLVTAEGTKELLIVDPKAGRVAARIPTGKEVSHMVAVSPDGKRAFVANIGSGSVTVIDLAEGRAVKDVSTGEGAEGIDVTPDGKEVWVTNRAADTVSVLDTRTLEVAATLKAGAFPIRVKVTPDGKRALVSCARSGDVAVFDIASRKEIKRISFSAAARRGRTRVNGRPATSPGEDQSPVPVGLLIAPDGKRAWVASTDADVVSVLDLDTLAVVGRLTAGREPDGLAGRF